MMEEAEPTSDSRWQQRALDRTLRNARERALARSSQFLTAAMELLHETGRIDFTVQSIVERSGLSLRSFYQHFAGKDELLLALFEELMTQFVEDLTKELAPLTEPFERLEMYVRGFVQGVLLSRPFGGRALTIYHLSLAVDRPEDFAKAIAPQLELLQEIVNEGVTSGDFRSDMPPAAMASLLNATLVSIAQMDLFDLHTTDDPLGPDEVWAWCRNAVTPLPAPRSRPRQQTRQRVSR